MSTDAVPTLLPFHEGGALFGAAGHEEAIARLLFLSEQRWPAGWLVGPSGCGKTIVLREAARQLRSAGAEAIHLCLYGLDAGEFWTELASALGSREIERGLAARKTVRGLLAASAMMNRPVTMLLDDADGGIEPLWDAIAGLVRISEGLSPGHTVVVASSGAPPAGNLTGRIDLRAEVPPFSEEETGAYLTHRLVAAHGTVSFDEDAVMELHRRTGGVPAMINRFADLALVSAQAAESDRVTAAFVATAAEQLRPVEEEALVRFTVNHPRSRASA